MAIPLPPKVYETIAPVFELQDGVYPLVRISKLIKVFDGHFGCQVEKPKGRGVKISPPALGQGTWMWPRKSIVVRKTGNDWLTREDLYSIRKMLKNAYEWDDKTFERGG